MGKLHNSVDSSIPAVKLYWDRLQNGNEQSLVTLAKKNNPLWAKANLISHLSNRLRRGHSDPKKPLLKSVTEEIKQNSIVTLDADKTNVSGSLVYVPTEKHRHALQPGTIPNKKHRIAILRWLSGGICRHTKCKICDEELSRDHGLECAGANAFLNQTIGQLVEPNYLPHLNLLDRILNKFRDRPQSTNFYSEVYQAISMIYIKCLGYVQAANGFWLPEEFVQSQDRATQPPSGVG
jgi:hypothetical protein